MGKCRALISYRELRVGMRIADRPRGFPTVTRVDGRGYATRWGYGFYPKIGRLKVLRDDGALS